LRAVRLRTPLATATLFGEFTKHSGPLWNPLFEVSWTSQLLALRVAPLNSSAKVQVHVPPVALATLAPQLGPDGGTVVVVGATVVVVVGATVVVVVGATVVVVGFTVVVVGFTVVVVVGKYHHHHHGMLAALAGLAGIASTPRRQAAARAMVRRARPRSVRVVVMPEVSTGDGAVLMALSRIGPFDPRALPREPTETGRAIRACLARKRPMPGSWRAGHQSLAVGAGGEPAAGVSCC
jgi:hypothetical protein